MIKTSFDSNHQEATIVLQPNHSWTWQANLYLIASLLVISLTVGIVLTLLGYWLILVFTTAEIAILTACLYVCVNQTHRQEVLRFTADRLVVERGRRRPEQQVSTPRYLARFWVCTPSGYAKKQKVSLLYGNKEMEVGEFLAEAEKTALVKILRNTIERLDRHAAAY